MFNMPLISIIIPIYNVEKYLSRCLDSVLAQTYKNLEILLIDDGSTDSSAIICDEYARKDVRIKVFHKSNGGVSSARNLGLDKARGEYIGFIDADDEIHPDMYQMLFTQLQQTKADIAACQVEYIKEGVTPTFSVMNRKQFVFESPEDMCICLGGGYYLGGITCNKLFSKNVIKEIRFNVKTVRAEDTEFLIRISDNVNRFVIIPQILYAYYYHSQSALHRPSLLYLLDECKVMKFFIDFCKERNYLRAISSANKLLIHRTLGATLVLCFADVHNKHLILLREQLKYFKNNKALIKVLPTRKQRVFATCLAYFPKSTIFIVRLPFVQYFFNKRYHFDTYEL